MPADRVRVHWKLNQRKTTTAKRVPPGRASAPAHFQHGGPAPESGPGLVVPGLSPTQYNTAELIISQGRAHGASGDQILAALAIAADESNLGKEPTFNTSGGNLLVGGVGGVYQQAPESGWGTREQVMQPGYAVPAFWDAYIQVMKTHPGMGAMEAAVLTQNPQLGDSAVGSDYWNQVQAKMSQPPYQAAASLLGSPRRSVGHQSGGLAGKPGCAPDPRHTYRPPTQNQTGEPVRPRTMRDRASAATARHYQGGGDVPKQDHSQIINIGPVPLVVGEDQDPMNMWALHRQWSKPSNTDYQTPLNPADEQEFRAWITRNHVKFNPDQKHADYDMRGYWLAMKTGQLGDIAEWRGYPDDPEVIRRTQAGHFPDKWLTPYASHLTPESIYSTPDNPFSHWGPPGNTLYDVRTGLPVFTYEGAPLAK